MTVEHRLTMNQLKLAAALRGLDVEQLKEEPRLKASPSQRKHLEFAHSTLLDELEAERGGRRLSKRVSSPPRQNNEAILCGNPFSRGRGGRVP